MRSVEDVKITVTVTNDGAQDLKILNYANALDDGRPTQSFVVSKDGEEVEFTGITVRRRPAFPLAFSPY